MSTVEYADEESFPPTAPNGFSVSALGIDSEERATKLAQLIGRYVYELSRYVDLSQLDGVTIATDYNQALLNLDRGFVSSHKLTPTDNFAIGIAMTPTVIRNGSVKSHIVLHSGLAVALETPENEHYRTALHTLAHECAHVEITHQFNSTFPGMLLQKVHSNAHEDFRWQVILTCWDEYAATRKSALIGYDPTSNYEETFLTLLKEARQKANDCIKAYRLHRDIKKILSEIYEIYGSLLKFAAYHLGNMDGRGITVHDLPKTMEALNEHGFSTNFDRLHVLCKCIFDDYGKWNDKSHFEAIGDFVNEIIAEAGLKISQLENGQLYIDIPLTPETTP